MRSVGVESVPSRSPANGRGIKPGSLNQDVASLIRDHGVEPDHHSRERDRFHRIGDGPDPRA